MYARTEVARAYELEGTLRTENALLDDDGDAQRLQDRGVLYAPDYIVNAGVSSTRFTSWMETTIATPQRLRRRRSSTRAGW